MKDNHKPGDTKNFIRKVEKADSAAFDTGEVHPVYATFAVARDAEWACRLFVLDMKDDDEEGIGTFITLKHVSPALIGEEVRFDAELIYLNKNEVISAYRATCGDRLIAEGETGQKILKKTKLGQIFEELQGK